MSDLADFLLARFAEDEAKARECLAWVENAPSLNECATHHDPARILAECDAKRQIVGLEGCYACSDAWTPCEHREITLRLLALPYADHPDYHEEWRP